MTIPQLSLIIGLYYVMVCIMRYTNKYEYMITNRKTHKLLRN